MPTAQVNVTHQCHLFSALARRFLEPLAGTLIWDAAQRAFRKLRSGSGYLEKLAILFHSTSIGASDYSARSDIVDRRMMAIEDRNIAFITYRSAPREVPLTLARPEVARLRKKRSQDASEVIRITWVIVRNLFRQFHRKQRVQLRLRSMSCDIASLAANPLSDLVAREREAVVNDARGSLPRE
jgi:hypothetical protein